MISALPGPQDYERLDRYLKVAFQLLEGIATIEEAQGRLSRYLESEERELLPEELESLLMELFFLKCRREFPLEEG